MRRFASRSLGALALAAAVLGHAAAPASAHAPQVLAPPGNSAISEYTETVPTASGGKPTGSILAGHARAVRALRNGSGGGGLGGIVLPVLMGVSFVGAAGIVLRQRREPT
jgi:hypothetical protein